MAYYIGIILHKAPAAFALVLLLLLSEYSKKVVYFCLVLFAAMSPLGAIVGQALNMTAETFIPILAIVVGSFLHISTTIIFEVDNTQHHRISWKKMAAIVGGLVFAILSSYH